MKHLPDKTFDVAVIGCGPAGMMAAISAASRGARAAVLDQLRRPAAKLLASGGGRCNITNTLPDNDFIARFGRAGGFMRPALSLMGARELRRFLAQLGVATYSPDGVRIFPVSNSSGTVADALFRRMGELGVVLIGSTAVTGLKIADGMTAGVNTAEGSISSNCVVLATGGKGYASLGGSSSGYDIARSIGHRVVAPVPALVPLIAAEEWVRRIAGVAVENVAVAVKAGGKQAQTSHGAMLFTHRGVSGPAILDISGLVSESLPRRRPIEIRINLVPDFGPGYWPAEFDAWQRRSGGKRIATLLAGRLPKSLAEALCALAGVAPDARAASFTADCRKKMARLLAALPLSITATEGFEQAMVTRGGVSLKDIDPNTLESRILPGLFLAGEVLDLDGPTGGFNLQWAFAAGWLAGRSASLVALRGRD